jgi:hypothetical protein
LLLLVKISTVLATRDCCFMLLLLAVPPALHAHSKDVNVPVRHTRPMHETTRPIMLHACHRFRHTQHMPETAQHVHETTQRMRQPIQTHTAHA